MDSNTNTANDNAGTVENKAKSILGTLSQVSEAGMKTTTGVEYGRALFTYVNGYGETKTLTMLAFGKAYQSLKDVWTEGHEGYVYCRYEVTPKGTTLRAINKGRAPSVKAEAQAVAA